MLGLGLGSLEMGEACLNGADGLEAPLANEGFCLCLEGFALVGGVGRNDCGAGTCTAGCLWGTGAGLGTSCWTPRGPFGCSGVLAGKLGVLWACDLAGKLGDC